MSLDRATFYDAELERHQRHLRAALDIGRRDHVLDIGCGAGQSTLEAARAAMEGEALGIDVAADMLAVARRRGAEAGIGNTRFELGDAQVHDFPPAHFDLCISRFGTMFFADPLAAFANIGKAMRPGARLVMMVWQSRERNEWAIGIREVLASVGVTPAGASPAFSLADPAVTKGILTVSGFAAVDFADIHEPVFYGPTVDAAHGAAVDLFLPKDGLADASASKARERLRTLLEAHSTADGVLFDSRAWVVTARRTGAG